MSDTRGTAPRTHFLTRTTTDKLCRELDAATEQRVEVLVVQHVGGRDWVIVTRGNPILGPAGSRVLRPHGEEQR